MSALDNPVWEALHAGHVALATATERAARYPADVSPLAGLAEPSAAALAELAALFDAGEVVAVFLPEALPDGSDWKQLERLELIQMRCETPVAPAKTGLTPLSNDDVPAMLELTQATQPGPFGPRTLEMGRYIGFHEAGRLVAMGGERLKPAGHTEVSAICTSPQARGRGLAEAVVRTLVSDIQHRGEVAFLHVWAGSPSRPTAVALYERLGFRERMRRPLAILQRA